MTNDPFRNLALAHIARCPNDHRTLDELERYYRNLPNQSPFGRLTSGALAADALAAQLKAIEERNRAVVTIQHHTSPDAGNDKDEDNGQ